ncbi:MAG TPA: WD40 repeat domain-containing protein, partial [Chthonomonadaceae bacterium]|nr:WD40 repeat domain-containing protein [Chthonomonadaceae bacterium]
TRNAEDRGFEWRFWQGLCPLQHSVSVHTGEVLCAASSPDGKQFVTGGTDKSVVVSDTATGKALHRWKEDGDARAAAFSPDGSRIAVGLSGNGKPGRAVIRDTESGRPLQTLALDHAVWDIAFSHNGKLLATNGDRVQIWDAETGAPKEDYGPGGPALVFSPDDTRICYSRWAETGKPAAVEVLDLSTGMVLFPLAAQTGPGQVRALAWSADGSEIATGGDDRIVRVWSAATGTLLRSLSGHSDGILTASFSPDGKRLLTSSLDDEARIWELDAASELPKAVIALPPGARGRPPLRDLRLFARENRMLFKHARQAVFANDGQHVVTGSYSGMVRIWSATPPASYLVLDGPAIASLDHVGAVAIAPNNRQIVSAVDSPAATVWDARTGAQERVLRGQADISAVAYFPDSSRIVTAGQNGAVQIWTAPRRSYAIQGHKGNASCVAVSSNGRLVASGGEDGAAIVWDVRANRRLCSLSMPGAIAHGIAFSPDGAKIAVAQNDNRMTGRITLWDTNSGKLLRTIASLPTRVLAVRFSPDGARILAGVDDRTARIWDVVTGKPLLTLAGHNSGINSVAFSADGRRVVTGSFDTTARLWDARTGQEILTLHHPTFVVGVALSPDGRRIVTACEDGSTRVWTAE